MLSEKKVQIYLPLELYQRSKEYAKTNDTSIASIVRISLEEYLTKKTKDLSWEDDSVTKAVGFIGTLCPSDLAQNHDKYLYEEGE